jgi:hypothetical protein
MISGSSRADGLDYLDDDSARGGMGGFLTTAVVAAAVGAGVALLFAPEKGVKTRKKLKKRIDRLELGSRVAELDLENRANALGALAGSGVEYVKRRGRKPEKRRGARGPLLGLLGSVAGAALVAYLTPQGERMRSAASGRVGDFRRNRRAPSSFDEPSSFGADPLAEPRTPVRDVTDTAQDPTKAF